jgi:putative addiction module component (TIGR02574 family)
LRPETGFDETEFMMPKELLAEINRLSLKERLDLVKDVWDAIAATPESVPLPDSHRQELDRRLDRPSAEPSQTWDQIRKRLRKHG